MTLTAIESQQSAPSNGQKADEQKADDVQTGEEARPRSRWGWPLAREITIIVVGLVLYRLVRLVAMDEIDTALLNSQRIVDWEQALGIFNEVGLQSLVLGNDALIWILNRYYFLGHFLGMAMLLTWLYIAQYDYYGRVRRVLITSTVAALVIHVSFPLAPPRWFPQHGFIDTLQLYGPKIYDSETIANTANQIAAMPSLHVGWALIAGWAITTSTRSRWRWLGYGHPIAMTLAVVITANHWWLDVIGAVVLVYAAILFDRPLQRMLERRKQRRSADETAALSSPTN